MSRGSRTSWTPWTSRTPWSSEWRGCLHQVGKELLSTNTGYRDIVLWYHWRNTSRTHRGGANYLCMPKDPEYSTTLTYRDGVQGSAYVYGTEYKQPLQGEQVHNAPCAVCYVSTRPTVVMIPAKASCPPTWTREYYGYIMTDVKGSPPHPRGRSMFECVDKDQESLPGSAANTPGATFHHVEASCSAGGLPCLPYNDHQELNCVVCTK